MNSPNLVKVDKVRSKWFSSHFDQLQASNDAGCMRLVKVVKVKFSRT